MSLTTTAVAGLERSGSGAGAPVPSSTILVFAIECPAADATINANSSGARIKDLPGLNFMANPSRVFIRSSDGRMMLARNAALNTCCCFHRLRTSMDSRISLVLSMEPQFVIACNTLKVLSGYIDEGFQRFSAAISRMQACGSDREARARFNWQ